MGKPATASIAVELDYVQAPTRRWFLALALADFVQARGAVLEAHAPESDSGSGPSSRAVEHAALCYARPFHYCLTPSGRTSIRLPRRFLEPLDWRLVTVHYRMLKLRNQLVAHRDIADARLTLQAAPHRSDATLSAILERPATSTSERADMLKLIELSIALIGSELTQMEMGDPAGELLFSSSSENLDVSPAPGD
jgi:hypothetical protein